MLEDLEEMNLFVIPLDDERHWYRYHHLSADVLRKRLEHQHAQLLPGLHRRASQWYEQNGFMAESIQAGHRGRRPDRAAQLIEQNGCLLLMSGEVATLLHWTDAIEFQSEARPWLAIQKAWALALTGNLKQVEPTLQAPEKLLEPRQPTLEVSTMQGTIAAARAHCANAQGDTGAAAEYARHALDLLPDCSSISLSIRSVSTSILGDASRINGQFGGGHPRLRRGHPHRQGRREPLHGHHCQSNLGDVFIEQGQLHQAADTFTRSLQMAVRPDWQKIAVGRESVRRPGPAGL